MLSCQHDPGVQARGLKDADHRSQLDRLRSGTQNDRDARRSAMTAGIIGILRAFSGILKRSDAVLPLAQPVFPPGFPPRPRHPPVEQRPPPSPPGSQPQTARQTSADGSAPALNRLFSLAHDEGHSDVHLGVGESPRYRARGEMQRTDWPITDQDVFQNWLREILSPQQIDAFFERRS